MKRLIKISLLICLWIVSLHGFGQSKRDSTKVNSFVELGMSANAYKGDLSGSYKQFTPGLTVALQLNRKRWLNGNFALNYGKVIAQNLYPVFKELPEGVVPANFVNTSFFSANYMLQLNLLKKKRYRLYVGQGVGFMRINPKDQNGNKLATVNNSREPNEAISNVTIFLPTQAGFNYYFNNNYSLGFSVNWLNPSTDYIDNLSNLGTRKGNDNILAYKFNLLIPIKRK